MNEWIILFDEEPKKRKLVEVLRRDVMTSDRYTVIAKLSSKKIKFNNLIYVLQCWIMDNGEHFEAKALDKWRNIN